MKKSSIIFVSVTAVVMVALLIGIILLEPHESGDITETMKDAVLHENDKIDFLGLKVNPGFISALITTVIVVVFAAVVRIFAIPRFKLQPGKFQLLIETIVNFFDSLAKQNSPHRNGFLGAYIFAAGIYIFVSTLLELIGLQWVAASGESVTLGAPLADINAAIALGVLSYLVILSGGIASNGFVGAGRTLKEFSLPISMSFRLFGALLSGLLVTELVYHFIALSFVLPVVVGVLFTLLHALIQTYVLVMLTSLFYGEVTEPKKKKAKVRTLTDEQYNEYLMALKDERPTMLIDENGKRRPQK